MKQDILKSKKHYFISNIKKSLKKIGKTFVGITITALLGSMIYSSFIPKLNNSNIRNAFIEKYGYDDSYISLSNIGQTRLNAPLISENTKFNILIDDLSNEEKEQMLNVISELNSIFEVINPNYKFIIDFNPNIVDIINPVNVNVLESTLNETKKGKWFSILKYISLNGLSPLYSVIQLNYHKENFNMENVFMHEIMHHLGLADAYKLDERIKVQSILDTAIRLRKNDIAILVALYADLSTEENQKKMVEFINNYELSQDWLKEKIERADTNKTKIIEFIKDRFQVEEKDISFVFNKDTYIVNNKTYMNGFVNENTKIEDNLLKYQYFSLFSFENNNIINMFIEKTYDIYNTPENLCLYIEDYIPFVLFSVNGSFYKCDISQDDHFYALPCGDITNSKSYNESLKINEKYSNLNKDELFPTYIKSLYNKMENIAKKYQLKEVNIDEFNISSWYFPHIEYKFDLDKNIVILQSLNNESLYQSLTTKYGILTESNFFTLDKDNNLIVYNVDLANCSLTEHLKLNQRIFNDNLQLE